MSAKHRRSKRKGRSFEQRIARDLRDALRDAKAVTRTPQNAIGHGLPDISAPGLHVETKHRLRPNPRAALEQAERDAEHCGRGKWPVAVVRYDDGPGQKGCEMAVMRWVDFKELYSQWHAETK